MNANTYRLYEVRTHFVFATLEGGEERHSTRDLITFNKEAAENRARKLAREIRSDRITHFELRTMEQDGSLVESQRIEKEIQL